MISSETAIYTDGEGFTSSSKSPYVIMVIGFLFFFIMIYPYREFSIPIPLIVFLGIMSLLGLIFLAFTQFELLLIIFAVYIPFSREFPGDFGGILTAFNLTNFLMIAILIGIFSTSSFKEERVLIRTPIDFPLLLFAVFGCISLIRAGMTTNPDNAFGMIIPMKQWMTPMLGYFLFLAAVKDRGISKKVVVAIMVNTALIGLLTIKEGIDMGTLSTWEKSRVDGVFQHSNTLGAFFVYYSFLFAGLFLEYLRNVKYWLLAFPFLICARGMSLTISRGAILSFGFAAIVTAFFKNKIWFVLSVLVIAVALRYPSILPETISGRFYSTVQQDSSQAPPYEKTLESSAKTRVDIMRGGIPMIKHHPMLGIGYGMHLYTIGIDTHNTFLKIAIEMGLIALIFFVLLMIIIFFCTLYVYRHTDDRFMRGIALGFLGGLGGMALCNFFGSRLDGTEFVSYFWILAAIMMKERHLLKEKLRMEAEKEETEDNLKDLPLNKEKKGYQIGYAY